MMYWLGRLRLPALVMLLVCGILMHCAPTHSDDPADDDIENDTTTRKVVVLDHDTAALAHVLDISAPVEVLAEGFIWTEGPLWIPDQQQLLFSDVPANKVYAWTEAGGTRVYLNPSGYTGTEQLAGESGSNGLAMSHDRHYLYLCQHGDRRIARMEALLREPQPVFITIADQWQGKRFNSPNDLVVSTQGQIYFTDPPYGLKQQDDDPEKEIPFQGVYRRDLDGTITLLIDSLSRPNGIALSPDEKTLYVANSDPEKAIWMAYELDEQGDIVNGSVFYDATAMVPEYKGLPDGMKVNREGVIFATGPGGVWVFDPAGKPLGRIDTGEATANCALNAAQTFLYICADDYLMRVALNG
jgi:gluconolactonase